MIFEYDIASAGVVVGELAGLITNEEATRLKGLPKAQRVISLGLISRDRNFGKILDAAIREVTARFVEKLGSRVTVFETTKDSVFIDTRLSSGDEYFWHDDVYDSDIRFVLKSTAIDRIEIKSPPFNCVILIGEDSSGETGGLRFRGFGDIDSSLNGYLKAMRVIIDSVYLLSDLPSYGLLAKIRRDLLGNKVFETPFYPVKVTDIADRDCIYDAYLLLSQVVGRVKAT